MRAMVSAEANYSSGILYIPNLHSKKETKYIIQIAFMDGHIYA